MHVEKTATADVQRPPPNLAASVEELACEPSRGSWMATVPGETEVSSLVRSVLGKPEVQGTIALWRIREFGRPCLVSLHTWNSGAQTVTIFDSSRPAYDAIVNLVLDTPKAFHALKRELDRLTTWREEAADDEPMPRLPRVP
jgi:hypothetical protein